MIPRYHYKNVIIQTHICNHDEFCVVPMPDNCFISLYLFCRMPRRPNTTLMAKPSSDDEKPSSSEVEDRRPKRSAFLWLALFVLLLNGSWAVHHIQFENLPLPLSAEKAGKRGFSEVSAMEHVQSLTKLGPHPVGSDALDLALQVRMSLYGCIFS